MIVLETKREKREIYEQARSAITSIPNKYITEFINIISIWKILRVIIWPPCWGKENIGGYLLNSFIRISRIANHNIEKMHFVNFNDIDFYLVGWSPEKRFIDKIKYVIRKCNKIKKQYLGTCIFKVEINWVLDRKIVSNLKFTAIKRDLWVISDILWDSFQKKKDWKTPSKRGAVKVSKPNHFISEYFATNSLSLYSFRKYFICIELISEKASKILNEKSVRSNLQSENIQNFSIQKRQ